MAQRKTPALAHSEYVAPDTDNSTETWEARKLLVEATRRLCPTFLEKLEAKVFPQYEKLARKQTDLDRVALGSDSYRRLGQVGGRRVQMAIKRWARDFNAEVGWILDEAVRVLRGWYIAGDWHASHRWNLHYRCSISSADAGLFEFQYPGWDPSRFTWPLYRESVRAEFDEALAIYENKARALAESKGLVRPRRKYSQVNFDWFVLYQFAGMSSKEIADCCAETRSAVDESTVLKGIKAAAELLGWERLRDTNPPRRRKIR